MAILNNSNAISSGGYAINNSLRFRNSTTPYLNRTPASTGNRQIMTFSFWMKRGLLTYATNDLNIFTAYPAASNIDLISFSPSSDSLRVWFNGSASADLITTQVFRDPSAWYHIVVAIDTTQATAANRIKMYVNGTQITSFSTATYPSQNYNTYWNSSSYAAAIGTNLNGPQGSFDGYLTEINFIDGQALTPSSFGSTNSTTGVWQPAKYTGTYGTNGFYLNFSNIALTSGSNTGLGKDNSGNGNYWNTNNISVTAGTTYDAMIDSPTLTSATVANYATLNPVYKAQSQPTISNGNLTQTPTTTTYQNAFSTIGVTSGKWYVEITMAGTPNSANFFGIANATQLNYLMSNVDIPGTTTGTGYVYVALNGQKYTNGAGTAYGAALASGDVLGIAFDADAGTLTFYKNGVSQGTAFTGIDATTTYFFGGTVYSDGVTSVSYNFGQRPFAYTPPTGSVALNTYNLPTPTILQGNKYMDATTFTGTGSNATDVQTVVNQGQFKPDLVWTKSRSNAVSNHIGDSVRGIDKTLFSNTTGAEATYTYDIHAFNSNGFTVGNDGSQNTSGYTYVAWQWQAGQGTSTSNTSGSITSTVSVNTTAGFSVVTFTSTGAAGTVGHGLGVAPSMIIVKARNNASGWPVYHISVGNTGALRLDQTVATSTSIDWWRNTSPTSSVFSIGANFPNAYTEVAYCWAEISGFSKFGSYTGNGSTDGPFVYLGFRPKYLMIKCSSTAGLDWSITDSIRNPYNVTTYRLFANTSGAEGTQNEFDFLSNGFKIRTVNTNENYSGQTFIYAAFAENPFKNSLAR